MAKAKYVLAVDQGTTGTHVSILDDKLRVIGSSYREFTQYFPKPSWVEHDLDEIWASVEHCIRHALRSAKLTGKQIAAIGITNQRETAGMWMREGGKPLGHAIVWQDRRTSAQCARLREQGEEPRVRQTTGLVLDPYFSGTKFSWMLEHVKGARKRVEKGEACFGTIDSWLIYKMTGGRAHVTDVTNASRTLLMDVTLQQWDEAMCTLLGVPASSLPEIRGSAELLGTTQGMRSLPDGLPITGVAGDQQSALFGQACFSPGESKCTYGTGAFLLMNTGTTPVYSSAGLLTTVAWRINGETTYALEGSSFIAGAAVQWLRDGLKVIKKASDVEPLAASVKESGDVVFVPALAGLGAPHWRPEARGLFAGMDRATTVAHLARAALEGVAMQIHDLAEAMRRDSGKEIPTFKVDGGASANNLMMQFQADMLGTPVVRPQNLQTTSLGAAFLAGLGAGVWSGTDAIRRAWKAGKVFKPKMKPELRDRHLTKWRRAVERA